jgi:hypothetical protein
MPILRGRKSTLSFSLYQCPSSRTDTDVKTRFHRDRPNSRSGLDSADRVRRSSSNKDIKCALAARESLRSIPSSRCKRYQPAASPPAKTWLFGKSSWQEHDARKARMAAGQSRWWSQTGSNRRPPACKAGALPTELWPRPGSGRLSGLCTR